MNVGCLFLSRVEIQIRVDKCDESRRVLFV